jgi:hypothetical protein
MTRPDIYEMIQHSYTASALYVLTKHGVFDKLLAKGMSTEELAQECGMDEAALHALLQLASAQGFLRSKEGRYSTAKQGLLLTERAASWLRSYLMVWGEQLQPAFAHLENYAVSRTNAFATAMGAPIWECYGKDQVQHKIFVEFMARVTDQVHIPAIVQELRIGNAATLLDVGGGTGSMMCSLLDQHQQASGVVYDQPRNKRDAEARIDAHGQADRCSFVGGNMFSNVPAGADLYLIKHVLHDWDDSNAATILKSIAAAMDKDATLVIIEGLIDREDDSANLHFLHTRNIEQRVWTEGQVRSSAEFRELCARAGLNVSEIVHSSSLDVSFLYCKLS